MQLLEKAGVVRSARKGTRKKESVYELTARSIMLGPDPESKASIQATEHALDSILRLTSREVIAALRSGARRKGSIPLQQTEHVKLLRHAECLSSFIKNYCPGMEHVQEKGRLYGKVYL